MSVEDGGIVNVDKRIHGFVPKNVRIQQLAEMIRQVHHHNAVYPPPNRQESDSIRFTLREGEVFCDVMSGKTSAEIASKLKIKKHTVSEHRKNILGKLKEVKELNEIKNITDPKVVKFVDIHNLCN